METDAEKTNQRLQRINAKGWDVAQILSRLKAGQEVDLTQFDVFGVDDPREERIRRMRAYLDTINAARTRLQNDTYGHCLTCGRPLPSAVLDETPWQETCANCP